MPNYAINTVTITGPQQDRDRLKRLVRGKSPFDLKKVIPMPEGLYLSSGTRADRAMAVVEFRATGHSDELTGMLQGPWFKHRKIDSEAQLADILEAEDEKMRSSPRPAWYKRITSSHLTLVQFGRNLLDNIERHGSSTWYDWARLHWGTPGNTSDCSIVAEDTKRLKYRFDTAWYDPRPVFEKLKEMFPSLTIKIRVSGEVDKPFSYTAEAGLWDAQLPLIRQQIEEVRRSVAAQSTDGPNKAA